MFSSQGEERKYRYALLDSALRLYREFGITERVKSLSRCSRFSNGGLIVYVNNEGSLSIGGVNRCHSRSSCPVCSLYEQVKSLNQIREGIYQARKKGFSPYLVTYTFRHGLADELSVIQSGFSMARERMYRNGSLRRMMRDMGYVGRITDYEVQLCGANGYHPHSHELEFFRNDIDIKYFENEYCSYYMDALHEVGLTAREDVAVKITDYKGVGDYLTKLSSEMTLHLFSKDSFLGDSLSAMRCLSAYHETGDRWYGAWFVDYVINVKRKRFLGWSRGLKDLLNVNDQFSDDSDDEKEDLLYVPLSDVSKLDPWEWRDLVDGLNVGELDKVEKYLKDVRISYSLYDDGLKLLESRL